MTAPEEEAKLAAAIAELPSEPERDASLARTVSGYRCTRCKKKVKDLPEDGSDRCQATDCHGYLESIDRTELRCKACKRCKEHFLWRFKFRHAELAQRNATDGWYRKKALEGPDRCRACELEAGAAQKYAAAKAQHEASKRARVEQRAAVARHKVKETAPR